MRKILAFIMLLVVIWIAKLSYDSYQLSQQFDLLQQNMTQAEQTNANLNDHLVALQRQLATTTKAPASEPTTTSVNPNQNVTLSPVIVVKQQLELVQFALQQYQYVYAVDKLNQLNQSLHQYNLAPALESGLHSSIDQDKQAIQQFVLAKNQQQQIFDDLIQSIDRNLQQSQNDHSIELKREATRHFWEGWFQLEKVDRTPAELVNRGIILKEVQLRLLLARQAINDGHLTEYQHVLNLAIQQLEQLPDAQSQNLLKQVTKLKQLPTLSVPKLMTLGLLG